MIFEDKQLSVIAECERDMDSGKQPFVVNRGGRWAFSTDELEPLGIVSGQTVNDLLLRELLERRVANLTAKIAINNARTA